MGLSRLGDVARRPRSGTWRAFGRGWLSGRHARRITRRRSWVKPEACFRYGTRRVCKSRGVESLKAEVPTGVVTGEYDERFAGRRRRVRRQLPRARRSWRVAMRLRHEGETVVDVWGGSVDREMTAPWEGDTISIVMSCTKGAVALCAHVLASQGLLDIEAPVAEYWPEFATNGKENGDGADDARPLGRRPRVPRRTAARLHDPLGPGGRTHRGRGAVLGAGHAQRLPPHQLRVDRRRTRATGQRQVARRVLPRRDLRSRSASTSGSACPRNTSRACRT